MGKALVVDDNPSVLAVMRAVLKRTGYDVIATESAEDAVLAMESTAFDVAVVDYMLGGQTGLEVLGALTQKQPGCVRILVSGALDLDVALKAVNTGQVSRILQKPYDGNALLDAIAGARANMQTLGESVASSGAARDQENRQHLLDCINGDFLRMAVQPILNASDRKHTAYECLMRSNHDTLRGPLDVLLAAERHKLVEPLAEKLALLCKDLLLRLPEGRRLFVNLHPWELADPQALGERLTPLASAAEKVVVEITERGDVGRMKTLTESKQVLDDMGFSIAIDDLGAGFNTLSLLAELKPQYIKVDMSIIRDIDQDSHKSELLRLITQFAASTGSQVVAEGVETQGEVDRVLECGADLLQGYFFAKPGFDHF